VDHVEAVRDVLEAIGSPAKWRRTKDEVTALQVRDVQAAEMQQALQTAQQGVDVAKTAGEAGING